MSETQPRFSPEDIKGFEESFYKKGEEMTAKTEAAPAQIKEYIEKQKAERLIKAVGVEGEEKETPRTGTEG